MSKERAQRRAERLAMAESARASRARRRSRRGMLRRLNPLRLVPRLPDRRTGKLFARRSRTQRATIATGVLVALVLVWWLVDSLATKIAFTVLIAVCTPAIVVLTLDRRI